VGFATLQKTDEYVDLSYCNIMMTSGGKKSRGAKMQVLRKQLEETKARQVSKNKLYLYMI
jgi:hypothetical protein